ncbi:MAG: glutaredoxin [Nanoarchaeota archaeon]|nr:glutaredoxin [Nanoarchaeota archaeon]
MSSRPKITAYLKEQCGWSKGVRSVLNKYSIIYEEKTLSLADNYQEMIQLSNQTQQPTLQVNDVVLADVSGAEVEKFLLTNKYINEILPQTDGIDIGISCTDEEERAKFIPDEERQKSSQISNLGKVMTSDSMKGFLGG